MQRRFEDAVGARGAAVALAAVAGQGVEGGDPDPGVRVVGHGDEFVHGVGVDEVVEEAAAAFADGWVLVAEAGADGVQRVLAAPSSSW
ncbi:hypothetical protein GCM10017771_42950 [Streptomyces capitiformicae]|uniref:Uncharacterized protein n=1 Tax=Streptomyces capitiformicae TaxID=2014920 RepID=A0A918YXJ6_9ACTN|nr:hypothetical protein GCM10017771_42950 [Streptomyces capitiformicae]